MSIVDGEANFANRATILEVTEEDEIKEIEKLEGMEKEICESGLKSIILY